MTITINMTYKAENNVLIYSIPPKKVILMVLAIIPSVIMFLDHSDPFAISG